MNDHTKLDRLLELRRHEEERRTHELALARRAVSDAEDALEKLQAQRLEIEEVLGGIKGESVGQVKTLRLLLEQITRGIRNAQTVRALACATAAEREEEFVEASQSREALERVVVPRHEQARALEEMAERQQEYEAALVRFRTRGRGQP